MILVDGITLLCNDLQVTLLSHFPAPILVATWVTHGSILVIFYFLSYPFSSFIQFFRNSALPHSILFLVILTAYFLSGGSPGYCHGKLKISCLNLIKGWCLSRRLQYRFKLFLSLFLFKNVLIMCLIDERMLHHGNIQLEQFHSPLMTFLLLFAKSISIIQTSWDKCFY